MIARSRATKPKLLVCTKSFWPSIGGTEEAARYLADAVSDRFELTVLTVGADRRGDVARLGRTTIVRTGLLAYRLSTPLSLSYTSTYRALAKNSDLVHIHSPHPLGELAAVAAVHAPPILLSYHFDVLRHRAFRMVYEPVLLRALRRADRIVCSSPSVACTSSVLSRFPSKIRVIPYGIDVDQYRLDGTDAAAVREIRSTYKRPLALFVGRLVSYKGIEYLLRAVSRVDVGLVVIGEGYLEGKLKKMIRELNLGSRVSLLRQMPHNKLRLYFHACDFFVLPSVTRSEFFGIVLLEAMACRKPLITTEIGTGTSWVNQHGETGLVVPPQDETALARAMGILATEAGTARRLGETGYRRVVEAFTLQRFTAAYTQLYLELLCNR
jgi:rhamnosyl/mannosyltransferase